MNVKHLLKRRRLLVAAAFAAAAVVAVAVKAPTPVVVQKSALEPRIIAASFTSAWCSSCRILEPRLAAAMPAFKNKPVEFVEFDFTFGENEDLARLAATHGLARLYEANKGATGFTVLVDARSGAIVDTLTMNFTVEDIKGALRRALSVASYTDE